jgi:hypothetical protein
MTFIHYSITISFHVIFKTSYIANYILYRPMDLTYLTNATFAIGFMSRYATIEFLEM